MTYQENLKAASPLPQPVSPRVPGIDVLRGLCILAVVVHHINLRIRFDHSSVGKLFPAASNVLVWSGYYGVIVFFVISGFLITTWSLKRWNSLENISRRQFYWMRFARIAPCLVGLLVILSILDRAGAPRFTINPQHTSLLRAVLSALTFHVNWLEAKTGYLPASWDVLWSLSVEEVFYLVFPLLCTWIRKERYLVPALCLFVIIGPFARVLTHNSLWADYGYLSCMDGIALGCLAAILAQRISFSTKALLALRWAGILACIFIVALRGLAFRIGFYKAGLDVTLLELGTALLVIAFQQGFEKQGASKPRFTALFRWFGRNSYEVYLTHMFVIWPAVWLFYRFHQSLNFALLWFAGAAMLAGTLGHAVAHFYSEPLNRLLRRQFLRQRQFAAAEAASHSS